MAEQPRPFTEAELARLREKPMRLDGAKARLLATVDMLREELKRRGETK